MTQNVTHDQVIGLINNGDLMFVDGWKHPIAMIIQFFTKSKFSHVGILFWMTTPTGQKKLMITEAQGGTTLRIQDFEYYHKEPLAIIAAPKDWNSYEPIALKRIGLVKYDYFEAAYVGLRDFCFKYLGFTLPHVNFHGGEICSEFVARCLGLPSSDVSPEDLFEQLNLPIKFYVTG